jgi:hypothetical protein
MPKKKKKSIIFAAEGAITKKPKSGPDVPRKKKRKTRRKVTGNVEVRVLDATAMDEEAGRKAEDWQRKCLFGKRQLRVPSHYTIYSHRVLPAANFVKSKSTNTTQQ